jgi:hypothetical protein
VAQVSLLRPEFGSATKPNAAIVPFQRKTQVSNARPGPPATIGHRHRKEKASFAAVCEAVSFGVLFGTAKQTAEKGFFQVGPGFSLDI